MITRCPECATAFRVTAAQLDTRQGRVRCGHCGEIFDAVAFLETDPEDATTAAAAEAAPPPEPPTEAATPPDASVPEASAATSPAEPEDLPFAPRKPPRGRGWWTAAAVVLLIALNVQALFYFRGAIALVWPESKPYIDALCEGMGCEVPLPKRSELMSIETSDLQAEPASPGVMVLSATLRNRAAFPQAYPALELTLTNEQDQPLARRVLTPPEYLRKTPEEGIPSCTGGVASCEVQVRMHLEAAALKASGYRLYLFYP
jgi:predicted Zn finger-like uncharacterized protein